MEEGILQPDKLNNSELRASMEWVEWMRATDKVFIMGPSSLNSLLVRIILVC